VRHFDLVIIGTGSGNTILDERYDDLDVAIVEQGPFGGTCVNVGCVPTKMFVYAADVAETIRGASMYGIDATVDKVRWTDIRDRVFGRIDRIAVDGKRYRIEDNPNVTVYTGHGVFTEHKAMQVYLADGSGQPEEISADQFVIAAGARPVIPAEVTASTVPPFHTSDTIMRIDTLPERLVILGGGYVASEFAHIFGALGSDVTIVARGPQLLRQLDETLSERFTACARERWRVHTGAGVAHIDGDENEVRLLLHDGDTITGDTLLVATGRTPNADRLDVGATGVATHPDGRIVVDRHQRTTADGIYALGDVSSPYQLKHVANHEAAVVAHNLLRPEEPITTDHRYVPAAVFTDPQIATVGLTETQAEKYGLDYTVKIQNYSDIAFGWAAEDTTGFCKVIATRGTGDLLGAHVMGPQAATVIQPLIQAMSFGLRAREMARGQYWIHPAPPEVVENALLGLEL
jgi:mycothione reductase